MQEEMYYYWLDNVPGIGRMAMRRILEHCTPGSLYEKGTGDMDLPLSEKQRTALEEYRKSWDVEREWQKLKEKGIRFWCRESVDYPDKIKLIPDAPLVLYQKGPYYRFTEPIVAVIGARECSAYGSLAAKELGRILAERGIVVVSGMARGIDGISQWQALQSGGRSIGVLGCGIEVCYPSQNRPLYERLLREGCLLSENLPYQTPKAGYFPQRNRLISGLADVVAVVEAREKSGTFITVDMALEQGKEVYAMPGRITDSLSRGCNGLIRQGAGVLLSPTEFADEVSTMLTGGNKMEDKKEKITYLLSGQEEDLYRILEQLPMSVEDIWQKGRQKNPTLTLAQVMEGLLTLVMKGMACTHEQYFYRSHLI